MARDQAESDAHGARKARPHQELAEAKIFITGSYPLRFDSSRKIASQLLSIQEQELRHRLFHQAQCAGRRGQHRRRPAGRQAPAPGRRAHHHHRRSAEGRHRRSKELSLAGGPDAHPPAVGRDRQSHRRRRGGRAAGQRRQGAGGKRPRRRRARRIDITLHGGGRHAHPRQRRRRRHGADELDAGGRAPCHLEAAPTRS